MRAIVDDQIALIARLDALEIPDEVDRPLLTVYGFEVRLASAIGVERATGGVLQRLFHLYGEPGTDSLQLLTSESAFVRVLNPTEYVVDIASARTELRCNLLAAEVVAAARREKAEVRLVRSNADGQLRSVLAAANIRTAVWDFERGATGLRVVEE